MNLSRNTPFIVIDVQKTFDNPSWGRRNNPDAEDKIAKLIQYWRETGRPIIFVQHISEKADSLFYINGDTVQFKIQAKPKESEAIIRKHVNSAFIGTDLLQRLKEMKCKRVVIAGLTTNHCVETTTRMAGNYGLNPILVEDACATFDRQGPDGTNFTAEQIHEMTLVNLNEEFAEIVTTEQLFSRSIS
ncbi:cysteine hydrolase family protein [Alkalihalobacillus sp. AL-G]|uniref:cysteine hydrolase family protein n=1 Tax=Alkalihalobacillus sp. AL-G TaxID=2926399 RepID=UPI00272D96F6|nr:cysteine hydrolase family protein [Alkalihalobacillus sp. AL-G]WLD94028.1 cysteine hydrolase [Alkalihalobacillus sp. AL-G]